MRNVHERTVRAGAAVVAPLIDALGGPDDRIWPADRWPAMRMSAGTAVGSAGGHAFIRYRVEASGHGRVVLRFDPSLRLDGTHAFTSEPVDGGTLVRHEIDAEPASFMRVAWPLYVRPLHDALIEDLLDGLEAAAQGTTPVRRPLARGIRLRRRLASLVRRATAPAGIARDQ